MRTEEIVATISSTGEVEIQVQGVKGMECLTVTAALEQALGGEIVSREMSDEAYETTVQVENEQETGW